MRWLNKLPDSIRSASGLEWRLWRKLPLIAVVGTVLPLIALAVAHYSVDADNAADARWLQIANYMVAGVVVFHWTALLTVAIGCVVVMLMKGPAYVADAMPLSHRDTPNADTSSTEP